MNTLPSPASTPSPSSNDSPAQAGRKRQRSQSMQSDKSSGSVKRAASEAPAQDATFQNNQADQMSTLSLADQAQEIDAYMATQGEDSIPTTLSVSQQSQSMVAAENMSPSEKLVFVEDGKKERMEIGQTWFLVSHVWYKRWRKACTGEEDKEGAVTEQELGPVDNSPLIDSDGSLKQGLLEGEDVEFVPQHVWRYLTIWYGEPTHVFSRRVIPRGLSKEPTLELQPPRFKVLPLSNPRSAVRVPEPPCKLVDVSSSETMTMLCTMVSGVVASAQQITVPYRLWLVNPNDEGWECNAFPAERVWPANGKVLEESMKSIEEEGLANGDGLVVEFKQQDSWILDAKGMHEQQQLPTVSVPLFNSKDGFFNRMGNVASSSKNKSSDSLSPFKTPPPKSSSTVSLFGNSRNLRTLEPGTLGLTNMGNTCFMNSALQCLTHTKELTDYFLSGVFEDELNADNPLGMGGAIAETFGSLLQRTWDSVGSSTSYSPREFKQALQKFAPQFSGYQQHDSQELVAFLLDGLHEDLNRILKKPYVEKPDWEGGGDLELVQLAKKSWDGYLLRNDSVIVDLFQGQYQSTLVCPECEKVSITFDPFMYLTLPIPIEKKWTHTIYYVPLNPQQPHVKVPIELNRDASFKDLKNLLGRWMNTEPENLLTLEVFSHRYYKNLDDNVMVGDMSDHDAIVCFELDCNSQQSRTFRRQPTDPLILPVFLCDAKGINQWNNYASRLSLFGYPTVLAIKPEDAKSTDTIYNAVMHRLTRFTRHVTDLFTWEHGSPSDLPEVQAQIGTIGTTDTVTEIVENGDVMTVETAPGEGDIVDEKSMIVDDEGQEPTPVGPPKVLGFKKNIFNLRLHTGHKEFGTSNYGANLTNKWESWERREEMCGSLLREGDAIYCEFDEHLKAYYFGESINRYEHARWDEWVDFIHPEYEASIQATKEKKNKGLSLQDCLDEFTKEEKLGEDDLWYCPRCKKHQQATKRFDLWKVPDILVVHLKRFSNSRTLRDKIDAFIDFPIEGLNLENMVGERAIAKKLLEQGVNIEELNLTSPDEPLVYDLYGVDEHIGGLGGGHYRAYALNHENDKWYHFDDSYVKPAKPEDAVNADAYLLFYRRRTSKPLGGKLQERIAEHKATKVNAPQQTTDTTPPPTASQDLSVPVDINLDNGLPTPPDDNGLRYLVPPPGDISNRLDRNGTGRWAMRSGASESSLTASDGPPELTDPCLDIVDGDDNTDGFGGYHGEHPSNRDSPTSSLDPDWNDPMYQDLGTRNLDLHRLSPASDNWGEPGSNLASPSYSNASSENTNGTGKKTFTTAVEEPENDDVRNSP
ncbi:Ubiquitin carboxyl-terminal hydrolase 4 [Leucoagaricus sp. SymC.cos]|nr:Ubiquitin carboxyl-terminal hydrolase 4 [Leucoagaricus sp. SymC.cos]